jgi:hypothetical protein
VREGSRDGGVGDDGVGDGASISGSGGRLDYRTSASAMKMAHHSWGDCFQRLILLSGNY